MTFTKEEYGEEEYKKNTILCDLRQDMYFFCAVKVTFRSLLWLQANYKISFFFNTFEIWWEMMSSKYQVVLLTISFIYRCKIFSNCV